MLKLSRVAWAACVVLAACPCAPLVSPLRAAEPSRPDWWPTTTPWSPCRHRRRSRSSRWGDDGQAGRALPGLVMEPGGPSNSANGRGCTIRSSTSSISSGRRQERLLLRRWRNGRVRGPGLPRRPPARSQWELPFYRVEKGRGQQGRLMWFGTDAFYRDDNPLRLKNYRQFHLQPWTLPDGSRVKSPYELGLVDFEGRLQPWEYSEVSRIAGDCQGPRAGGLLGRRPRPEPPQFAAAWAASAATITPTLAAGGLRSQPGDDARHSSRPSCTSITISTTRG